MTIHRETLSIATLVISRDGSWAQAEDKAVEGFATDTKIQNAPAPLTRERNTHTLRDTQRRDLTGSRKPLWLISPFLPPQRARVYTNFSRTSTSLFATWMIEGAGRGESCFRGPSADRCSSHRARKNWICPRQAPGAFIYSRFNERIRCNLCAFVRMNNKCG